MQPQLPSPMAISDTLPPLRNYVSLPGQVFAPAVRKRKRGDFELNIDVESDVVASGVISYDNAVVYFRTFFEGCVSFPR